MPLTVEGSGYRDFSEPRFFSCDSESQIEQIEIPVNNAFAFVADPAGSDAFELWRFNSASTAAASSTVILPLNPQFVTTGRWIKIPTGGGGGGGGVQSGSGSPEGIADASNGQLYWDTDAEALYINLSTSGTSGWFLLIQFGP